MMWFYYWCKENLDLDWKSFSRAMIRRFGAQMKKSKEGLMLENPEVEAAKTDEIILQVKINVGATEEKTKMVTEEKDEEKTA